MKRIYDHRPEQLYIFVSQLLESDLDPITRCKLIAFVSLSLIDGLNKALVCAPNDIRSFLTDASFNQLMSLPVPELNRINPFRVFSSYKWALAL